MRCFGHKSPALVAEFKARAGRLITDHAEADTGQRGGVPTDNARTAWRTQTQEKVLARGNGRNPSGDRRFLRAGRANRDITDLCVPR